MYNHDGQNLFVIDGHMHFWDANPDNWKNKYGESWIKCFHAFHSGLSPAEEDEETLANDLFRSGYVDMAILNSTYLYEFYKNGFNSHVQNNVIKAKYPDRFLLCGSFDPRGRRGRVRRLSPDDGGIPDPGAEALHRRMAQRFARLASQRSLGL